MQEYGLYLTYAKYPLFVGTKEECKAHVDDLTETQKERGYTIAPIPPETYDGPYVDPALAKQVCILALVVIRGHSDPSLGADSSEEVGHEPWRCCRMRLGGVRCPETRP